jgi:DNA (cytosine-5)-methyltransferase 1
LAKYKIDSFFAGVGGIELGFEQTGKCKTIWANEFDKYAQKTYELNNTNVTLDKRDIHDIKAKEIPACDILVGGYPVNHLVLQAIVKALKIPEVHCSLKCLE